MHREGYPQKRWITLVQSLHNTVIFEQGNLHSILSIETKDHHGAQETWQALGHQFHKVAWIILYGIYCGLRQHSRSYVTEDAHHDMPSMLICKISCSPDQGKCQRR